MAWIGSVLNIAGAAMGMAGGVADGQATAADRTFQWQQAGENARVVAQQTGQRELAVRRDARQQLGAQAAAIAESGTGYGGSNRLIGEQDAVMAELDALNTRYEGALRVSELDNQQRLLSVQKPDMSPVSWQVHRKRFSEGFGALPKIGG